MTRREFLAWVEFYRLYPFDDFNRFHRPAALQAQFAGQGRVELQPLLDWLQPDSRNDGLTDSDMKTMRAFGYKGRPQ